MGDRLTESLNEERYESLFNGGEWNAASINMKGATGGIKAYGVGGSCHGRGILPACYRARRPVPLPRGSLGNTTYRNRERRCSRKGDPNPLAEPNALAQDDGGKEHRGHWRNGGEDGGNRNATLLCRQQEE